MATQQKLGLLPQRRLECGAADYFVTDVHRPHLMDDLIRRSAANLLAISLALTDDADESSDASANEPAADSELSASTIDEKALQLTQKQCAPE